MKIIYVDIDNTITKTVGLNYKKAKPVKSKIKAINMWYDAGNTIIYWTSRGALCNDKYKEKVQKLTLKQLKKWGCKYHRLRMDKPLYDEFYDDRAFNAKVL